MATLQVGDVLREGPRGAFRVVRSLSRYPDGRLRTVSFAIRRRSWTNRCYTVLNATDLRLRRFRKVDIPPRVWRSPLDGRIARAIAAPTAAWLPDEPTADDVIGLP